MAVHVLDEASRCLNCKKPLCQKGCPINTPIPQVISLMKDGKLDEAGRMLFENNPLTSICSLVCNHENQCEGHCILGKKGSPVHFSGIEHYISDTFSSKMTKGPAQSNGMRVAIIGSGPAGLTIAVLLARKGYRVTIFESKEKIGGILRYGIPEFRLPKNILDDFEYRHLILKDIKIRPNTSIGKSITVDHLLRDGYLSIFIGTGVWQPKTLNIKGETLGHVHFAINYLNSPDSFHLGEHVIVIGAGNSAMDCARTAIRKGVNHLQCFALRDKVSASQHEYKYALLEGVEFVFLKMPVEIVDDGVIFADTRLDSNGAPQKIEGSEKFYPADSIIISISQGPQDKLLKTTKGLHANEQGLIAVDEKGHTSRPEIFAGGDVVAGARTVVEAVAFAKTVAEEMDKYMRNLKKSQCPESF